MVVVEGRFLSLSLSLSPSLSLSLSLSQDDITGDGTTSNVLIIGELLKQADLFVSEVYTVCCSWTSISMTVTLLTCMQLLTLL